MNSTHHAHAWGLDDVCLTCHASRRSSADYDRGYRAAVEDVIAEVEKLASVYMPCSIAGHLRAWAAKRKGARTDGT